MATPFSPFCGRIAKQPVRKRQSQIPSDLIDWDAPEIPELEKQKIIYEDHIREITEDNEIEQFLKDEIFQVVHDTVVQEYQDKLNRLQDELNQEKKSMEKDLTKEKSTVNLLLGQIKMFEENVKENMIRIEELERECEQKQAALSEVEQEKEKLAEEKVELLGEIENLNFRNNETLVELSELMELSKQRKSEAVDSKKKLDALKTQLSYYKKLAKNKGANEN